MKALVYHGNKDLRVEEVLEPETQQGQVKLAVDFCGICATDIEEYYTYDKPGTYEVSFTYGPLAPATAQLTAN